MRAAVAFVVVVAAGAACGEYAAENEATTPVDDASTPEATAGDATTEAAQTPVGLRPCDAGPSTAEIFATAEAGVPALLAADAAHVYWSIGATLERQGVEGGGVQSFVTAAGNVTGLALSNDYVVFVYGAGVRASSKNGGAWANVISDATGAFAANGLMVFASTLDPDIEVSVLPQGSKNHVSFAGATAMSASAALLAWVGPAGDAGQGFAIWKASTGAGAVPVKVLEDGSVPSRLVNDDASIFFSDRGAKSLMRVAAAGGPSVTLASNQEGLGGLVLDDDFLYYATADGVRRVPKNGNGCIAQLSKGPVAEIAVSRGYVYFLDGASIKRVPK